MVKRLEIDWAESAEELEACYKGEKQVERRTRLLALWHLRQGKRIADVVAMLKVSYRTVQRWKRDGLPTTKDGFFDLDEVRKCREEFQTLQTRQPAVYRTIVKRY